MGNAWSTHKSKREEQAKAKRYTVLRSLDFTSRFNLQKFLQLFLFFLHRLRNESRVRSPDSRLGISERLPMPTSQMKDNNLFLEENNLLDDSELATSEEWKLPYKSLRLDICSVRRYFARNILNYCYNIVQKTAFPKRIFARYCIGKKKFCILDM